MHINQKKCTRSTDGILRRTALFILVTYVILALLFYFLADEQLHFRPSRGDFGFPVADSGITELTSDTIVEQRFTNKIQRLEEISVQWGDSYHPNADTVTLGLYDPESGELILGETFDASVIGEGGVTTMKPSSPIEGFYRKPLLLRLSSDGKLGSSATPWMRTETAGVEEALQDSEIDMGDLTLNGERYPGILCFRVIGTDYIWSGLYYWRIVAAGFVFLLLGMVAVGLRYRRGRRSYLINAVIAMEKYRFLIRQLVSRDFKTKYKRSILGVFWSFLNPLLTMCVQYFVFSTIFKSDVSNFAVYLLIGVVMFNFFSEACGMALTSILGNSSLITKVYMPKYIYPLTRVISSLINLAISLIPLVIVCFVTGVRFQKSAVLSIYFLLCLVVFCLGLGLLLSTSMVFFRDTQFLWSVLTMMWMYATPIFYPETILPEKFSFVLTINPLYHFLKSTRLCILDGISPEPVVYIQCLLIALGMLLIGALIFHRHQDRFLLYL